MRQKKLYLIRIVLRMNQSPILVVSCYLVLSIIIWKIEKIGIEKLLHVLLIVCIMILIISLSFWSNDRYHYMYIYIYIFINFLDYVRSICEKDWKLRNLLQKRFMFTDHVFQVKQKVNWYFFFFFFFLFLVERIAWFFTKCSETYSLQMYIWLRKRWIWIMPTITSFTIRFYCSACTNIKREFNGG